MRLSGKRTFPDPCGCPDPRTRLGIHNGIGAAHRDSSCGNSEERSEPHLCQPWGRCGGKASPEGGPSAAGGTGNPWGCAPVIPQELALVRLRMTTQQSLLEIIPRRSTSPGQEPPHIPEEPSQLPNVSMHWAPLETPPEEVPAPGDGHRAALGAFGGDIPHLHTFIRDLGRILHGKGCPALKGCPGAGAESPSQEVSKKCVEVSGLTLVVLGWVG